MTTQICLADFENKKQAFRKIHTDLVIKKVNNKFKFNANPYAFNGTSVVMYEHQDDEFVIPFNYALNFMRETEKTYFPNDDDFVENEFEFTGELLTRQKNILNEVLQTLYAQRSILLSLHCGFGKTIFAIYLSSLLTKEHKGRVLICCHRLVLIEQWKHAISKFTNATCQVLSSTEKIKEANFYIINIQTIQKRNLEDFDSVSVLVVDECHTICTQNLVRSLMFVRPKFCLGLSATPYRDDGMQDVLHRVFGEKIIHKQLQRLYSVYVCETGFKPTVSKQENGQMDWNDMLRQQSENKDRNELICKIAKYFVTRNILIICKRVAHANVLYEKLKETESVDCFMGTNKTFNSDARILLVTCSKGGVGFDHPKLDMLIVAADVENLFVQYLGRIFRRDDTFPIVVDMKDKNAAFQRHLKTRLGVYKETCGTVFDFNLEFRDFGKF
jgi:superfamily II DNA or RNA helicase